MKIISKRDDKTMVKVSLQFYMAFSFPNHNFQIVEKCSKKFSLPEKEKILYHEKERG